MGLPGRAARRAGSEHAEPAEPTEGTSFFAGWTQRNATARPYDGRDASDHRHRTKIALAGLLCAGAVTSVVLPAGSALADPSAHTWYRLRMCESSDNYSTDTGNGHYGAYQFDVSTWRSVGGSGLPSNAAPAEQDARALILYRERGWQPWQCAGILGLKDDSDAGTGRISDIHVPTSGGSRGSGGTHSSHGVPDFPGGSHQYFVGENGAAIRTFQNQMHKRGYFPAGTGEYGPKTLAMVKQLQRLNGLPALGYIGPKTWNLAWKGKYTAAGTSTTPTHPTTPPKKTTSTRAPAFPGRTHQYYVGEQNAAIRTFQNQMHKRGYFPAGTGEYGPKTLAMVKQLQRLNGLPALGYIGPKTWNLAWTGKYTAPK